MTHPHLPIGPLPTGPSGPVSGGQRGGGETAQSGVAGPGPGHSQKWRVVVADSAGEARQGTAVILAATGLIIWCIQNYWFDNRMPLPVSAAMWTLIPTFIGWLSTHVAFRKVTL